MGLEANSYGDSTPPSPRNETELQWQVGGDNASRNSNLEQRTTAEETFYLPTAFERAFLEGHLSRNYYPIGTQHVRYGGEGATTQVLLRATPGGGGRRRSP